MDEEAHSYPKTFERIASVESKILYEAEKVPAGISGQIDELRHRLDEAKRRSDASAEEFREKLLDGQPSEEEFRARLVMLEMEYASRMRMAEQGFLILAEHLQTYVGRSQAWLKVVCDEVRDAVRGEMGAVFQDAPEALAKTHEGPLKLQRSLEAARKRLERSEAGRVKSEEQLRKAEERAAELEKGMERELKGELSQLRNEREALGAKLAEAERGRESADKRLDEAAGRIGQLEAESRKIREALESARRELAEKAEITKTDPEELKRAKEELGSVTQRLHKSVDELGRARRQANEAEVAAESAKREAEGAEKRIAKLAGEKNALRERLTQAESELDAARKIARDTPAPRQRKPEGEDDTQTLSPKEAELERRVGEQSAEIDRLRSKINAINRGEAVPQPEGASAQVDSLRQQLAKARQDAKQFETDLYRERKASNMLQKKLMEVDAARDRALAETRASWAEEQERLEEEISNKTREVTTLRTQLEMNERTWAETQARQDAERMGEIFKLRAEIEKLRLRLKSENK